MNWRFSILKPVGVINFWSGIMRDHGEFFIMNLSSREYDFIKTAYFFRQVFPDLENETRSMIFCGIPGGKYLSDRVLPLLMNFINFKRSAVTRLMQCNIELSFPPGLINHMINEAREFYRDLCNSLIPDHMIREEKYCLMKIRSFK